MKRIASMMILLPFFLTQGCASIVTGNSQLIGINSNPDQAKITIKDEKNQIVYQGTTPTSVDLKKGDGYFHGKNYTVEIAKEGYSGQAVTIKSSVGGWYLLGNIVVGGLIGWFIVDPLTGAMWTLSPENINAGLQKSGNSLSRFDSNEIHIVLLKNVPENLRDKMVRLK